MEYLPVGEKINPISTVESSSPRPTKRAVDGGDSAAFSGFFYTRTESRS